MEKSGDEIHLVSNEVEEPWGRRGEVVVVAGEVVFDGRDDGGGEVEAAASSIHGV